MARRASDGPLPVHRFLRRFPVPGGALGAYRSLFVDSRASETVTQMPAWASPEYRRQGIGALPAEECCWQFLREEPNTLGKPCPDCGRWWRLGKKFRGAQARIIDWKGPPAVQHGRPKPISDVYLVRHLAWDTGLNFKVFALPSAERARYAVIDLDFKAFWPEIWRRDYVKNVLQRGDLAAAMNLENTLPDYVALYADFLKTATRVASALPGKVLAFRSSWTHGIHLYVFLDRKYWQAEVEKAIRAFLDRRGLLKLKGVDHEHLQPHPRQVLRLPLGLGSILLNPETLCPRFSGSTVDDQVPPALTWLTEKHDRILKGISLDAFKVAQKSQNTPGAPAAKPGQKPPPGPSGPKPGQKPPPPSEPHAGSETTSKTSRLEEAQRDWLAIWEQGARKPDGEDEPVHSRNYGGRIGRTRKVIKLLRSIGIYGQELEEAVHSWMLDKRKRRSPDVEAAIQAGDTCLSKIREENAELIEQLKAKGSRPDVEAPLPFALVEEIVRRVRDGGGRGWQATEGQSLYRLLTLACRAYAFAEYMTWAVWGRPSGAVSAPAWKDMAQDYRRSRDFLIHTAHVIEEGEGYSIKHKKAATWCFPLLGEAGLLIGERLGFHAALVRIFSGKGELARAFSPDMATTIKRKAKEEASLALWGSGKYATQLALPRLRRKLGKTSTHGSPRTGGPGRSPSGDHEGY